MALHNNYRRDKSTSWLAVTENIEMQCSHFDPRDPTYVAFMTKITKPVRKLVEQGLLKPSEDRKYAVKAFCEVVLKGWRAVKFDEDGKVEVVRDGEIEVTDGEYVKFSKEAAEELFNKYPSFYTDTVDMARELANFQLSDEERKNSESA